MAKKNTQKKEAIVETTAEQVIENRKADLLKMVEGLTTKSAKIRLLAAAGTTTGEIAKVLEIRYQHVRNVLTTQLKKGARE